MFLVHELYEDRFLAVFGQYFPNYLWYGFLFLNLQSISDCYFCKNE